MGPKESFLSQFDSAILPQMIEFGKRLTSLRPDVFMLMARKAVCLVDALSTLKLTTLRGVVTSDRVLDMDNSWLSDKSIALVDDALISGTTIFQTVKKLRLAGAGQLSVLPLCVNNE